MGAKVSRSDFEWVYTDEPHATRRKEILKKHPEIKGLMGHDPVFKYIVTAMVLVQCISFWLLKDSSFTTLFISAYCFGGVINHSLALAVHEISHNLAFGHAKPMYNRIFGMFANLPIGVPMSISFKKYHLEHHRYQGDEILDTDLPTKLEAKLFCSTFTKFIWVLLQPFFYSFRAFFVYPKPPTSLEVINTIVQIIFDVLVCYFCGLRMLGYMVGSLILAMGLHPVAGHFISEHYMFKKGFETYSYYGPLNFITFNVGYHMEHHDFPSVPGSRLPQVKNIAKEYYEDLPQHNSWCQVLWDFITDPEIGPYARVKRQHKARN
ncbi:sphingolipid delta(4)-desaturase DES1-like [Uloborus diversus]|uniref:sphingolipid delta(4)-desaturase DES1-like n=1 Tax=Uloborus diversus TaxID=327109 RepID=UPI00240A2BDD|nr:sphingolipid delta(4)-desaturase DES1-like [Uloborus diversus]